MRIIKCKKNLFEETFWDKVENWYRHYIRNTLWNIKNIILWIPVLWNNWDFDEAYLLKIMAHKFGLMERFFREDGITISASRHAHQCKVCKNLCKRLAEENYTSPWDILLEPAYKRPWEENPIEINGKICYEIKFNNSSKETLYFQLQHKHEEKMIKQDKELLLKMLDKYLREWWD